jgi:beta-lactamase regulating signal transducer with metallopeptidase domain
MVELMIWIVIGLICLFVFVVTAKALYRVVPVNEAHIRILMRRKTIFSARTQNSSYWYFPILTKLHKLPLKEITV